MLETINRQNDNSIAHIINPMNKFMKQIKQIFSSNGYYNIFIPNMKILSSDYKEYQEKLIAFNDKICSELGLKYDENMNLIRVKS